MGSIRTFLHLVVSIPILFTPLFAFSQNQSPGPAVLSAEMRRLEASASDPKSSGSVRRNALAELARLHRLSGDMESAAAAWSESAFAEPGSRDDDALLNAAECRIMLGEFERAEADVKTVLLTGKEPRSISRARYLGAQIEALRFPDGSVEALRTFIDEPAYADRRPATLYTLWRITAEDTYVERLKTDHPDSPEALSLSSDSGVTLNPVAPWVLLGGRARTSWSLPAGDEPRPGAAAKSSEESGPRILQIGIFRFEANARALAKRLRDAGFASEVQSRQGGSTGALWVVVVPPGNNQAETVLALENAGFEAFPVFN